jgi:hypothetical protein
MVLGAPIVTTLLADGSVPFTLDVFYCIDKSCGTTRKKVWAQTEREAVEAAENAVYNSYPKSAKFGR